MAPLVNDPQLFAEQSLAGFAAAQPEIVAPVAGGLVRATETPSGHVAVVMGGGSGHYPAFAGWVGVGFGSATAAGNVFASPSEGQVLRVARAADAGGGLLFAPINYAGDMLHFGAAAEALRAEGVDVRVVAVTDDIASGDIDDPQGRRGIAGSFIVIKIAGAAAERGDGLDEVERIMRSANRATRSFGVAFSGCTLPGADAPLFEIPEGRMALGLGIHGEPGLAEAPRGTADDVADALVDGLFAERPPEPGRRLAVLVNGLGATKWDELHVIFGRVRARLDAAGMVLVAPVVGEQVTSLDMAGVSLSIAYLDEELEQLWLAPATTASFVRGSASAPRRVALPTADDEHAESSAGGQAPPASAASQAAAAELVERFSAARAAVEDAQQQLGDIDAVAGDGDHGIGMSRGIAAAHRAATDALWQGAGLGTVLQRAGEAWSEVGGGTSGALWSGGLRAAGLQLGDDAAPNAAAVASAVTAFGDAITGAGGAEPGDKTMIDAIVPFAARLEREVADGAGLETAWRAAAAVAFTAAEATSELVARRGRSHIHGARSLGTPDAGAVSFALIVGAVV